MQILLECFVNALGEIWLMVEKPSLQIRKRLLQMLTQGGVKDMAISGKNKMLLLIEGGDRGNCLAINFIRVSIKITRVTLIAPEAP